MAEGQFRADDPSQQRINLQLTRAPKEGSIIVRTLSVVHGVLMHRPRDKDVPCPGPDLCPPRAHAVRSSWKGYLAALVWTTVPRAAWKPTVLEVSSKLAGELHYSEGHGEEWEVTRAVGPSGHREVTGRYRRVYDAASVKALTWIVPVLCKVCKTTAIRFDVENPFLAPPDLALVNDDPPEGFTAQDLRDAPMDGALWRKLRADAEAAALKNGGKK